jgi:hypothetical protein
MTTSLIDAESLLAFDIGSITTRAILFDVVEGRYRYLGTGTAPTTAGDPYHDISEGVRMALDQLQEITGRTLFGADGLIVPSQADGSGIDKCVATLSVGPPLKIVAVGLLEDISAASAQNLATTTYARVVETMSLNDRRKTVARLDTIYRIRPDLIVISGGTENGASRSVMALLEGIGLACTILPKEQRPAVLFAGNSALAGEVQNMLGNVTSLQVAPNVRPTLEIEQLTPAQPALAQVFRIVRARQIRGVQEVDLWTNGRLMPTATAFGRTIRYISKEYAKTKKGVLGIDVGASATVVASGFAGDLLLSVQSCMGLGDNLPCMLDLCSPEDILRWMPVEVAEDYLRDYIHNKALYPASLPVTPEELAIEQALACQAIHLAVKQAQKSYPSGISGSGQNLLPWFEPIIASGSVLTQAPTRGQALLTLLNAVQPTGVTTIALDRNNLAAALGAAAGVNQFLTIQSLDATNFLNLGTVISPVGVASVGTPVLQVRMSYADGHESNLEIKAGALEVIPLPMGQFGSLHLQPLHRFDVGMGGPGRGGSVKVMGGVFGVVIDARGRPLRLLSDPVRRREVFKKWLWTFGS